MARRRFRLRFGKQGNLRFIGHRDLMRTVERLLRRARLKVATSQGFHPKPRASYLSALPLGFSSCDEAMELILEEETSAEDLLARLNAASVPGLTFFSACVLDEKTPKQKARSFAYEMRIPVARVAETRAKVAEFLASETFPVVKSNGKELDARPCVLDLALDGDALRFTIAAQTGPEVGPRELLACLGLSAELYRTIFPMRVRSTLEVDERDEPPFATL